MKSINPANGNVLKEYEPTTDAALQRKVAHAVERQRQWRDVDIAERAALMRKAAVILRERASDYARLMAQEMGKPVTGGIAEIEKCALACDYYADNAARHLAPEDIDTDAAVSRIHFEPLGVVLAVMPWNYPFWQVFRFIAPTVMAGNTGLLKHASNVSGCALAIQQVIDDAGFPPGVFQSLLIGSDKVADLIASDDIAAVTLTGSTPAGKAVGAAAGKAIKPSVLELGGSDAYVVLEDADIELAAEKCVASRLLNTGQSCIAAKRFIVVESVAEAFEKAVADRLSRITPGDPLDEASEIGPMARVDLRDELHEQVQQSIEAGAKCVLGGVLPDGPGAWYPVTLLTGVRAGMPAHDDELFGPVAAIITARDEAHAIEIANDSVFGLGAAVFTRDTARGERIAAHQLQAGNCFINDSVKSDPRLPFGGIKTSGYGRELGAFGIRAFVNIKTVYRP